MANEANKALCRRHYAEVLSQKRTELVDQIYADPVKVGDTGSLPRAQFKAMAQMMIAAFPDLQVTVQDQIAEGDRVVTRWSVHATHKGDFMGLPPTGRAVTVTAIHIHQVVDGRIATLWEQFDMLSLRQQLGLGG